MADISIINKDNTDYNVKDAAGRLALAEVENKGAKNLFDIQHPSTVRSTSYNATADGGVELTCSNAAWTQYIITDIPVESGREYAFTLYVDEISGANTFRAYIRDNDSTGNVLFDSNNISTVKTINATITSDSGKIWVGIYINNSATAKTASAKIRAMLCTKAEWDISQAYVPYGKTNAELTSGISALSTENTSQQDEINYAVNAGAKNLLDYTFSINGNTRARTSNGVTFTINADRSISTSGTASANITNAWIQTNYVVPSDPVILSGCPADGADNKYRIDILDGTPTSAVVASDYGNGVVIKSSMFTNGIGLIRIRIEKGQNVNGLVFKPMIRPASITDSTFQPYAKTNCELTVAEDEDRAALVELANAGAKNVFKNAAVSKTNYSVTFTVNDDGTVSLSGTAATEVSVLEIGTVTPPAGSYIVSGCPAGGSWSPGTKKYRIRVAKNGAWDGDDIGNGRTITVNGSDTISLQINSGVGVDTAGLVFKPMIRRAEITDDTFVPYAPTNRELYEEKIDHDLPVVSGSILDYADTFAPGIYFARQSSSTGSGKPVNNRRYVYNIYVYSSATATIMAIEGEDPSNPRMFLTNKISGTWSSWYKFEGTVVT